MPARSYLDRMRHHSTDRGHGEYDSFRRHPYSFEDGYNRSFTGRHFDDPYLYDDASRGIKRSYYMTVSCKLSCSIFLDTLPLGRCLLHAML